MNVTDEKCLIAYFPRKGQNYVSGRLVDPKVGKTEVVANMIQETTGCDMFRIEFVTAYPRLYGIYRSSQK
jgi:flavodoxin